MMSGSTLRASLAYFAFVFGVGALLGPLREFVMTPRLGPTLAVSIETPFMLAASYWAALWALAKWPDAQPVGMGAAPLAVLLVAEVAGALVLRGMTLARYAAHLATPAGLLSLALFAAFGMMPWWIARCRQPPSQE